MSPYVATRCKNGEMTINVLVSLKYFLGTEEDERSDITGETLTFNKISSNIISVDIKIKLLMVLFI